MHDVMLFGSLVIVIVIFLFQDILYYFVNGSYKISQSYFMLIMLSPIVSLLCETTSYGIILSNKTKYNLYITLACMIANLGLGYILYPLLNIYSIVIGISFSAVLQFVLKTGIGQCFYKSIHFYPRTIVMFGLIVITCCLNIICYNDLSNRIIISMVVLLIALIVNVRHFTALVAKIRKRA